MKILIDECLPRTLKNHLAGHECRTVQEMAWSGKTTGALLSLAEYVFEVLVTIDQSIEYQQELTSRKIALLVFRARSNKIEDLLPMIPRALELLRDIRPGSLARVGPEPK